ncbi:MAG: PilW family protein [Planctomycetota bacterium]
MPSEHQFVATGLTLVEMVIALAIMTMVLAAVLPQFRAVDNSWDTRAGAAEFLQNGRVLIDHLNRNLSKAARITAVSGPSETNGYIEFQDNDANTLRYDIGGDSYVQFGPVGSLAALAGPVSRLQFTCYNALDLDTPITDANSIRSVKVETTLTNPAAMDRDMTFSTQAYLRTNALPVAGGGISKMSDPWPAYSSIGLRPALAKMSTTQYICAYQGDRADGYACILTVNAGDWSTSAAASLEYDTKSGMTPALARIDDTHCLCAYTGDRGDGWACIFEYTPPAMLSAYSRGQFHPAECHRPALCQIDTQGDTHHYLCAYGDPVSSVYAVVLGVTIIPIMEVTSAGPTISFAGRFSPAVALAKIDDTHYLCAYGGITGTDQAGAVVLTVNPADWTITTETHYDFGGEVADFPALGKIDDTHYLCAYQASSSGGRAVVLTVNPADWSITKETALDIDTTGRDPELCPVDNTNFLCAYSGPGDDGVAVTLTVSTSDWTISKSESFTFGPSCQMPALCQIDVGHYLCAYADYTQEGYEGVLALSGNGILP